ncbi:MAG: zf-HC2 domain-containing protein [Dehalococcoidia bacterium]|nr:zf-HC2 domain-containing protein [Dehalococcoidia bacterium]
MRFLNIFKRRELDCQEVRDVSSDFIDGDVSNKQKAKIAHHLGRCGPCTAFVNTLRATVDLLRAAPDVELPAGFKRRIRDSLSEQRV